MFHAGPIPIRGTKPVTSKHSSTELLVAFSVVLMSLLLLYQNILLYFQIGHWPC